MEPMTGIGKRVFRGVGTLTWVTWAAMKLHDWRSTSIRPCDCSVQRRVSTAHCTGPLRVLASDGRNQRLIAPFSSTLISTSVGGAMAHVSAAAAVGTRTGRFRFTVGTTLFWVLHTHSLLPIVSPLLEQLVRPRAPARQRDVPLASCGMDYDPRL